MHIFINISRLSAGRHSGAALPGTRVASRARASRPLLRTIIATIVHIVIIETVTINVIIAIISILVVTT